MGYYPNSTHNIPLPVLLLRRSLPAFIFSIKKLTNPVTIIITGVYYYYRGMIKGNMYSDAELLPLLGEVTS